MDDTAAWERKVPPRRPLKPDLAVLDIAASRNLEADLAALLAQREHVVLRAQDGHTVGVALSREAYELMMAEAGLLKDPDRLEAIRNYTIDPNRVLTLEQVFGKMEDSPETV